MSHEKYQQPEHPRQSGAGADGDHHSHAGMGERGVTRPMEMMHGGHIWLTMAPIALMLAPTCFGIDIADQPKAAQGETILSPGQSIVLQVSVEKPVVAQLHPNPFGR